jgi:hypothetical protein
MEVLLVVGTGVGCVVRSEVIPRDRPISVTEPIFSSERMLHKDYYSKNSVKKSMIMGLKGLDANTK